MCGISAIASEGPSKRSLERLVRMHAQIPHRGPDGEGWLTWSSGGSAKRTERAPDGDQPVSLGIGFRRLAILDRSPNGAQPMGNDEGTIWIAFNGEIYNYAALRDDLERRGHHFRSSGDTAVAVAAFEEWGSSCFAKFEGMWAIIIADLRNRSLIVSRDPVGIKPLYWHYDGRDLLFASEIKQILAAMDHDPVANAAVFASFLSGRRVPCLDDTFYQDVELVPSGSFATISLDRPARPSFTSFWSLPRRERSEKGYPEAVDELDEALRNVVGSHTVADVRLGSLVSGGLDSTLLGVLGHRISRRESFPTFSFGFGPRAPEFCELEYVNEVVRREQLTNYQTSFDPEWISENIGRSIRTLEEPPLASAALAQYRTFQLVRDEGTTVVLDGEASDEIFGGYQHHQRLALIDLARTEGLPGLARELGAMRRRSGHSSTQLVRDLLAPVRNRLFRKRGVPIVEPEWSGSPRKGLAEMTADRLDDPSRLNQRLYQELRWGNAKIVLLYTDKNSMAHSVEARVPYMDTAIIELAFSLPPAFKAGDGQTKRILRDVARRYLPPTITDRRDRMGFAAPEGRFLRESLLPIVRADVEKYLLDTDAIRKEPVLNLLDRFGDARSDDFRAVWRLWSAAVWRREFRVALAS